jgi:hypothetical protein
MDANCYKVLTSEVADYFFSQPTIPIPHWFIGAAPGGDIEISAGFSAGEFMRSNSNCRLNGDGSGSYADDIGPIRSPLDFIHCMEDMGVIINDRSTWDPVHVPGFNADGTVRENDTEPEGICFFLAGNHGEILIVGPRGIRRSSLDLVFSRLFRVQSVLCVRVM